MHRVSVSTANMFVHIVPDKWARTREGKLQIMEIKERGKEVGNSKYS